MKLENIHSTAVVSHGNFIRALPGIKPKNCEIIEFNQDLGENLAYISENGSVINNLNLLNLNFPNKIILSREKEELLEIFKNHPYIFNLGHGVLPETDPSMFEHMVNTVKNF